MIEEMTMTTTRNNGTDIYAISDPIIDATLTRAPDSDCATEATWSGRIPAVLCAALAKHDLEQQGITDRMPNITETQTASKTAATTLAMIGEIRLYKLRQTGE